MTRADLEGGIRLRHASHVAMHVPAVAFQGHCEPEGYAVQRREERRRAEGIAGRRAPQRVAPRGGMSMRQCPGWNARENVGAVPKRALDTQQSRDNSLLPCQRPSTFR
jgi:hypothetical protein